MVLFAFVGGLLLFAPFQSLTRADTGTGVGEAVAPKGLDTCDPSDPLIALETRVASSIGGQFLSCFKSEKQVGTPGAAASPEYAFAIRLAGGGYTTGDLAKLLATVTNQWRDFQPLSKEFREDYVARLNALMNDAGKPSAKFASIEPVLVSIDRLDAKSYSVVSVRSYVFNQNGQQVGTVKVNADAVVLRGGDFVRLTMQRVLTDVSDVAALQTEISAWARATESENP